MIVTEDKAAAILQWQKLVDALLADVQRWSEPRGWTVRSTRIDVEERNIPLYSVSTWDVLKTPMHGPDAVTFEPRRRFDLTSDGRVDIYSAIHSLYMVRDDAKDDWRIMTPGAIPLHRHWNERTFQATLQLLFELEAA